MQAITTFSTTGNSASLDLDALNNPTLIDFVLGNEDSTHVECEMASRLIGAMEEIDRLIAERAELLGNLGQVRH